MVATMKNVGGRRLRESYGRYYEDFEIGDIYEHRPGRTISETDNTWFTLLTINQHPLHFDEAYAAKSEFGRPLVNSCLTLSIVAGMSVSDVSQKAIGIWAGTTSSSRRPFSSETLFTPSLKSSISGSPPSGPPKGSCRSRRSARKPTERNSCRSSGRFLFPSAGMAWTTRRITETRCRNMLSGLT